MHETEPTWEEGAGFRETFLHRFTRPEHRRTLTGLSEMLEELWLEAAGFWPRGEVSLTRGELEAAARDLRHLQGFLAHVGQEHELSQLDKDDQELSRLAADLASDVGKIVERLDTTLTAPEGRPQ